MPERQYGAQLAPSKKRTVLVDLPGFGLVAGPDSELHFTWSPQACPPEVFESMIQILGLQVDDEWISGGVARGTLITREEADAPYQEGSTR